MTSTSQIRRLRRAEASNYLLEEWGLQYSVSTLAKLATIGGGPRFEKAGRFPLYRTEFLDEWAQYKLSPPVSSTSELAQLALRQTN